MNMYALIASSLLGLATPIVTNVVDALGVSLEDCRRQAPFSLVGHIIRRDGHSDFYTFWQHPHALSLTLHDAPPDISDDTLVRISGHFELRFKNRRCIATGVQPLRTGVRPKPIRLDSSQISDRRHLHAYVCFRGVIVKARPDAVDPRFTYLVLRDDKGILTAGIRTSAWPDDALIDAEVEIEGVIQESTGWRNGLPPMIVISHSSPINILRKAPASMDEIPMLTPLATIHRQRTDGRIIATCDERLFLMNQSLGTIMEVRPQRGESVPPAGSHVIVAGFARLNPFHIILDEALVQDDPTFPNSGQTLRNPAPVISITDLITRTNGSEIVDTRLHGHIVRCRGTVRRQKDDHAIGRFEIVDRQQPIVVDVSGIRPDNRILPDDGSTVEVTGLLLTEFENVDAYAALMSFRRFTLIPRNPDEIVTISAPPWWTSSRLLTAIAILLAILLGFAIWNRLLHMLAERRGKELFRARFANARADLKVEERTRLAVELHDALSQTLTGVAMQIETAASLTEDGSSPIRKILATAGQMLASCRGELQSCIWDLRSRTFDEKDMTEAVTRTVDTHIGTARLIVRFNVPRSPLSETTTHAILRIVRELAVNAVRHGAANEIRIAGNLDDGVIRFSVTDNGRGFEPNAAPGPRDGHFGLQGVRERLNEFAGTLEIESQVGKGTRIKVTMKPRDDQ